MKKSRPYTVYFAGELFSAKHLVGNAYLAEAIYERSQGKFQCVLPQNLDVRGRTMRGIRDLDLRALVACDLAVFNFDGTELDSGTVVEFMMAKFADIPCVLLRTDIRAGGDQRRDPWNLMCSFYPRTVVVRSDSLGHYRAVNVRHALAEHATRLAGQFSTASAQTMCERIAGEVVRGLERVLRLEPAMPKHLRAEIYNWLAVMPGFLGAPKELRKEFERILERKVQRDLL
jgi:hypothetical protein